MLLNIHNQGTVQTPVAKKPPTLNNEITTPSTATSSDSQTAGHYKLIEEQQKVIASMQETYVLEAKLEGRINVTQTVNSHLNNMAEAQEQYS